jgi:hypothetical protein
MASVTASGALLLVAMLSILRRCARRGKSCTHRCALRCARVCAPRSTTHNEPMLHETTTMQR